MEGRRMNEIIINGVRYNSKEEALKALSAIPDIRKISVGELNHGDRFIYGGIEWVKLDDTYGGVLVLTVNKQANSAFDDGGNNSWATAFLRYSLNASINGHFTAEFLKGINKDDLIEFERDLITEDGIIAYSTCKDFISLYTSNEYRKYRRLIPECREPHWTITADSLIYSSSARAINADGRLSSYDVRLGFCARPLCVLKSDVEVAVEE